MVEWCRDHLLDTYMLSWLGWSVDGSAYIRTQNHLQKEAICT